MYILLLRSIRIMMLLSSSDQAAYATLAAKHRSMKLQATVKSTQFEVYSDSGLTTLGRADSKARDKVDEQARIYDALKVVDRIC